MGKEIRNKLCLINILCLISSSILNFESHILKPLRYFDKSFRDAKLKGMDIEICSTAEVECRL